MLNFRNYRRGSNSSLADEELYGGVSSGLRGLGHIGQFYFYISPQSFIITFSYSYLANNKTGTLLPTFSLKKK